MTKFQANNALRSGTTLLVHGGKDAAGRLAWYFVFVSSPKLKAFRKACESGAVSLEQFANVLTSGFGEMPPQRVIERMKKVYDYQAT